MALISSSVTKTKSICTPKLGPPFLRHIQELIGLFAKELYCFVRESRLPCSGAALGLGRVEGGLQEDSNYFRGEGAVFSVLTSVSASTE